MEAVEYGRFVISLRWGVGLRRGGKRKRKKRARKRREEVEGRKGERAEDDSMSFARRDGVEERGVVGIWNYRR